MNTRIEKSVRYTHEYCILSAILYICCSAANLAPSRSVPAYALLQWRHSGESGAHHAGDIEQRRDEPGRANATYYRTTVRV